MISDQFAWMLFESMGSALARCHYGLATACNPGETYKYSRFETPWSTVIHRDIKPQNSEFVWKSRNWIGRESILMPPSLAGSPGQPDKSPRTCV